MSVLLALIIQLMHATKDDHKNFKPVICRVHIGRDRIVLLETILRHGAPEASGAAYNSDNGPKKLFLILNERRFSELLAAVLLQCQLFLLV